ncbi:MAG: extracellular solute-binding protein family 1, partial [Bacilli bacterium]|nr:extracellular solute-binding protein family 1 [Bacilli bacterium]
MPCQIPLGGRLLRKSIVSALTLIITVGPLLAACGNQTQSASSNSNQPVNLTFDWWGSTVRDQMTKQAITDFEKLHPNITVTPEFDGNFTDYFQKLSTQVSGGNAPDVIQMDYGYIKSYADRGALLDLSTQNIDLTNIAPSVVDSGKVNGKLYGIPNALNAYTIVYDPAMFEKAGITLSTRPTWDEWAKDLN